MLHDHVCFNITQQNTPDPYVTHANGKFYLTFTANDRIPLWEASSLLELWDKAQKGPVWIPPPDTHHSERLWAPELHAIRGRWYIFYAAANPAIGNASHRMYVLAGPHSSEDPHSREQWQFLGPIQGMDQRQWAIDGTVFELEGRLYLVYSGWPMPPERPWDDISESMQQLYIMELDDPCTARSAPVLISTPTHHWEKTGPVSINEGPQWLQSPDASWQGLVYSCGASWTKDYKMATLRLVGKDPLKLTSWQKSPKPLLQNSDHGGPYGPGHGSFLHFENTTVCLFHATDKQTDGNQGRKCRLQRLVWTEDGPYMGTTVGHTTICELLRMAPGSSSTN